MRESVISKTIRVALARVFKLHSFPNVVGQAWFGGFKSRNKDNGDVTLAGGRTYPVGLDEGSPDLIGWHCVIVEESMIGKRLPIFVGIEVKQPGKYAKPKQKEWQALLQQSGAICGVARSSEDALKIVETWEEKVRGK